MITCFLAMTTEQQGHRWSFRECHKHVASKMWWCTSSVNLVWNLGVVDPSKKNSTFHANFRKNFDFFRQFYKNFDSPGKNWSFTATSRQIILFLCKNHHFRTYLLYMIRYNNILRPVHDPTRPPCPKSGGHDPNPLRLDAPVMHCCKYHTRLARSIDNSFLHV